MNTPQADNGVVVIKSLDVKGSSLNAKMGMVVKNIKLVEDNNCRSKDRLSLSLPNL